MDRYKKVFKSKWQSQYTEEFKRSVCEEFLTGSDTKRSLEHKFGLGNSRLTFWLKEFGYQVQKPYIVKTSNMSAREQKNPKNIESEELRQLKKELKMARLEAAAYRIMIDIAEKEFKIEIRKKLDTRQ